MVKKGLPASILCVVLLVIIGTSAVNAIIAYPPCEQICGLIYKPVCGSDGRTYPNLCVFENARCRSPYLWLKCKGRCEECYLG
ncbi:PI-actitoxin-Avd5a-like [Macrobrachium rosenbergii]|uniref:PI-actitoxin-Avd5a-like n=1 Tax=Macrobrachium rosenbergii TaxID=79674 RepID=UPI0034D6049C